MYFNILYVFIIQYVFIQVEKYKLQVSINEERVVEFDCRLLELLKKVKDMEFEFLEVGIVKEQIEVFLVKYNKELVVLFLCVCDFEDQLLYEQDGFILFKMENERFRKRFNVKISYECELEDCIVEFERILKVVEEVVNVIVYDKKDVDDVKNKVEEKYYVVIRKLISLVKENN